jgi:hypothetical protein
MAKSDIQKRLKNKGAEMDPEAVETRVNIKIPSDESALLYDSYSTTQYGNPMDFIVIFDKNDKSIGIYIIDHPLGM